MMRARITPERLASTYRATFHEVAITVRSVYDFAVLLWLYRATLVYFLGFYNPGLAIEAFITLYIWIVPCVRLVTSENLLGEIEASDTTPAATDPTVDVSPVVSPAIEQALCDFTLWLYNDSPDEVPFIRRSTALRLLAQVTITFWALHDVRLAYVTCKGILLPILPYLLVVGSISVAMPELALETLNYMLEESWVDQNSTLVAFELAILEISQLPLTAYTVSFVGLCWYGLRLDRWTRTMIRFAIRLPYSVGATILNAPRGYLWIHKSRIQAPYWRAKSRIRQWRWKSIHYPTGPPQGAEETYTYHLLPPGSIRLLDIALQRGSDDIYTGELQCHLRTVSLSACGKFDAISYTWGNPEPRRWVHIDAKRMLIPANAYNILRDRAPWRGSCAIWIDCICINQADDKEKDQQVPLMDQIYHGAERTVLWLGDCFDVPDAELVKSLIADLVRRRQLTSINPTRDPLLSLFSRKLLIERFQSMDSKDVRYPALASLLKHDYFFRVWIMQEIVFSRAVHIRCGGCWMDWDDFAGVLSLMADPQRQDLVGGGVLRGHVDEPCALGRVAQLAKHRDNATLAKFSVRPRLCDVLNDLWMPKATDKRDLVFGVLNLSSEPKDGVFAPDYSALKDPADFFVDIARRFHDRHELHEIMYSAGIGYPSANEVFPARWEQSPVPNLPSWVPDWSSPPLMPSLRRKHPPYSSYGSGPVYNACDGRKLQLRLVADRYLAVSAVHVDWIASVSPKPFPGTKMGRTSPEMRLWEMSFAEIEAKRLIAPLAPTYVTSDQPKMEALWRTLIGDVCPVLHGDQLEAEMGRPVPLLAYQLQESERPAPQSLLKEFAAWDAVLVAIEESRLDLETCKRAWVEVSARASMSLLSDGERNAMMKIVVQMSATSRQTQLVKSEFAQQFSLNRKFALTERGYMALVPPGTQTGDAVHVFDGMEMPFITRKANGSSSTVQLVGESYVHGIMDGEARRGAVVTKLLLV